MMLPSSLLTAIFLLATSTSAAPAPAADDGQWHPEQYGGAAVASTADSYGAATAILGSAAMGKPTMTVQTKPLDTTAPTYPLVAASQTKAVVASGAVAGTVTAASWESEVTWPAGCESWANPCPPGAKISGGGVAGYTNGFTSYLTETDSNGVITGMPTKATVAAGVTEAPSTMLTSTKAASNATFSSKGPSSTRTGFSSGQTEPVQSTGGAGALTIFSTSSVLIVGAVMAMLL